MTKPKRPLSLITCTADRPFCFNLYERWLSRMLDAYGGEVQLIVVDGGQEPVTPTLGQEYYRTRYQHAPLESFWSNMAEAMSHVKHGTVGFIEDDDYYSRDFLINTVDLFDRRLHVNIVGEGHARYWHVPSCGYQDNHNRQHASLCQTMLCGNLVQEMKDVVALRESAYLDMIIWRKPRAQRMVVIPPKPWCVGMKGMPGRTGFVGGHRAAWYKQADPTGKVLRDWIGEDADVYLSLAEPVDK